MSGGWGLIYLKYEFYRDKANEWRWQLLTINERIIADSAEAYANKQDCLDAIDLVKGSGSAPVRERKMEHAPRERVAG